MRQIPGRFASSLLVLCLLAVACETSGNEGGGSDAAADAVAADTTGRPDSATGDGTGSPDTALPDTALPDTALPDTGPPADTALPPPDVPVSEDGLWPEDTAPSSCPALGQTDCLASSECILELSGADAYVCRAAANDCERQTGRADCQAANGCLWNEGACYCPPDELCACGGGAPPACRALTDAGPCATPHENFQCPGGYECCDATATTLGECRPEGHCGETAAEGCALRLEIRNDGGLCPWGACFDRWRVHAGGYLWLDGETPWTPRDVVMDETWTARFEELLAAVDALALAPGYGECCEAWVDGSDMYVRFFLPGPVEREVRISDRGQAPPELLALVEHVEQAAYARVGEEDTVDAEAAACLYEVPAYDGPPPATCENAEALAGDVFRWAIDGPDGQHLDRDRIELDGVDEHALPIVFTIDGILTASRPPLGPWTIITEEGAEWSLSFLQREAATTPLCAAVGQPVRLTALVAWGYERYIHGVVLSGDRGVLFVTDEGLSGIHEAAEVPFDVAVQAELCEQGMDETDCEPHGARELAFAAGANGLVLRTGEWGRLAVDGAYDLAVYDLRSYATGLCDDYWNYAYVGYGIAGSDFPQCSTAR